MTALPDAETLVGLFAAWLLLFGAAAWAWREKLDLGKRMLLASLRGLVQLLVLAFVLHWIFDIRSPWAQAHQASCVLLRCNTIRNRSACVG